MINALNLTIPLKQDEKSLKAIEELKKNFSKEIQPHIDKALQESNIVHFARVLIIDNKYIQVLTEYDGDKQIYTDYFRKALPKVFAQIFSLAQGDVPAWDELKDNPERFYDFSKKFNLRSLGDKDDDPDDGYLFSAFGDKEVAEIKKAIK